MLEQKVGDAWQKIDQSVKETGCVEQADRLFMKTKLGPGQGLESRTLEIRLAVVSIPATNRQKEINARLGGTTMLSEMTWPAYDEAALVRTEIELVVQVNGKLRDRLMVSKDIDEEGAKAAAFASSKVNEHLEGKTIRKIVFIPGKIFNIVAN